MLTGLVLSIFFIFCIINASYSFLSLNNPNSTLITSDQYSVINKTAKDSLDSFKNVAAVEEAAVANDQPTPIYLFLIFVRAFLTPIALLKAGVEMLAGLTSTIIPALFPLNSGSSITIIIGVVNALMLVAFIFAVISWIRTGRGHT